MRRAFLCILLGVLSSSSALAGGESSLSRENALAIAKKTAKAHGIHLDRYKLEAFPRELSEDGKEWTFFFSVHAPTHSTRLSFLGQCRTLNGYSYVSPLRVAHA